MNNHNNGKGSSMSVGRRQPDMSLSPREKAELVERLVFESLMGGDEVVTSEDLTKELGYQVRLGPFSDNCHFIRPSDD